MATASPCAKASSVDVMDLYKRIIDRTIDECRNIQSPAVLEELRRRWSLTLMRRLKAMNEAAEAADAAQLQGNGHGVEVSTGGVDHKFVGASTFIGASQISQRMSEARDVQSSPSSSPSFVAPRSAQIYVPDLSGVKPAFAVQSEQIENQKEAASWTTKMSFYCARGGDAKVPVEKVGCATAASVPSLSALGGDQGTGGVTGSPSGDAKAFNEFELGKDKSIEEEGEDDDFKDAEVERADIAPLKSQHESNATEDDIDEFEDAEVELAIPNQSLPSSSAPSQGNTPSAAAPSPSAVKARRSISSSSDAAFTLESTNVEALTGRCEPESFAGQTVGSILRAEDSESDLDASDLSDLEDEEPPEAADTIVAQFERVYRADTKRKHEGKHVWRVLLRSGIMQIGGREVIFDRCDGEFSF